MDIIVELGQNHNGDMDVALQLIDAAKRHGGDVAKFQLFDARRLFPGPDENEWYDYNCRAELTRDQVRQLARACAAAGIEFMASVFDVERIDWLEEVGVKRYKIASRSIHDRELIGALARTGKPLLVSLGHWKQPVFPVIESDAPVEFLYCVSEYPTPLSKLDFRSIDFTRYAGFSDHTIGIAASMVAMSRGARIIEKHFTLDKAMYGPDHAGSMTPPELQELHDFRTLYARARS